MNYDNKMDHLPESHGTRTGCHELMDKIYEYSGEEYLPFFERLRLQIHLLFCHSCAEQARKLELINEMLASDFFPACPSFENSVMEEIYDEDALEQAETLPEVPGGISFRTWVIIGFFILVSLATSFFGMDFIKVASRHGSSFLLPLGITIGIVLTGYGAFFIGSHLKELSSHFKLH